MKLAGTVILFYPPENVFAHIATYIHEIDVLYIFNNTPHETIRIPDEIKDKCRYLHTGENEGIAKKLNEAMKLAETEGFDYLLTMDQDSFFGDGDLEKYKRIISEEVQAMYRVELIAKVPGVTERFYALSVERKIKHPAVLAISEVARKKLQYQK
jgi:rhamnosyltransferase